MPAVRDFAGYSGCRSEGRRYDVLACEVVDYACCDDVHEHTDNVEPDDGGGVILAPAVVLSAQPHSMMVLS